MHCILCVVVISEEKRNEEGGEERKRREVAIKKFSDLQNIAKFKIRRTPSSVIVATVLVYFSLWC